MIIGEISKYRVGDLPEGSTFTYDDSDPIECVKMVIDKGDDYVQFIRLLNGLTGRIANHGIVFHRPISIDFV